jgi:2,3-bisphosphoglycerate-dependent phosphoglycerate mutase
MAPIKLVLIRHGETTWNKENKFTGWTDVDLSEKGLKEVHEAGKVLNREGYSFDQGFTSFLKRAKETLRITLKEMGLSKVPVQESWRLNERHYGALQGLNKAEMSAKFGEEQVKKWRRGYATPPPPLELKDLRHPLHDPLYKDIDRKHLPSSESLKDTVARVVPYWESEIAPAVRLGKKVIVSASGNSLRALVKFLDNVPEEEIVEYNIPTAVPLVYELDKNLKPIRHYFLGDQEEIRRKIESVANQAKAKR